METNVVYDWNCRRNVFVEIFAYTLKIF